MTINLICIERGFAPYVAYEDLTGANSGAQRRTQILDDPQRQESLKILYNLEAEDMRSRRYWTGEYYTDDGNSPI